MRAKIIDFFKNGQIESEYICDIILNDKHISVTYSDFDDNDMQIATVYKGTELKEGHFSLFNAKTNGRIIMHSLDYCVFNGWFYEDYRESMFKIVCEKPIKSI